MDRKTTRRLYRVARHEISYLRYTLESYDGMATVSTLDPHHAVIEVRIAPGCESDVEQLILSLRSKEGLLVEPLSPPAPNASLTDPVSLEDIGAKREFHIITMGCQMNAYDSDTVARMLVRAGWQPVGDPGKARMVLINTCSVREKPEHKAISMLGRMASIKSRHPRMILGIMGCFAQQRGEDLIRRFPALNLVMGPRAIGSFPEILARIEADPARPVLALGTSDFPLDPEPAAGRFEGKVSGYLAIMQGCDNFCTYCIVPYVRGRERSRDPAAVLQEAERLIARGAREITLLGQNVNSYRWETGSIRKFADLLRAMDRLKGLKRLRFTTSHPKDLSNELIGCFAELPTLCPHLHLPFQAGSDTVLKRMGRGYTRDDYLALIDKLRSIQPGIALTSDVMVGFPGETAADFQDTLDLIGRVGFDSLYSFKYSDRPGTAASRLPNKVPEGEKTHRLEILQGMQKSITLKRNEALLGAVVQVLVEGESRRGQQLTGRTGTNKIVNFRKRNVSLGDTVDVIIKEAFANSLRGEALDQAYEP